MTNTNVVDFSATTETPSVYDDIEFAVAEALKRIDRSIAENTAVLTALQARELRLEAARQEVLHHERSGGALADAFLAARAIADSQPEESSDASWEICILLADSLNDCTDRIYECAERVGA